MSRHARTPVGRPSRSRARTAISLALAGAATVAVLPAGSSAAEPRPTIHSVSQRVDALDAQVDVIVEEYANSRLALTEATRRTAVVQRRVALAQADLDRVRLSMSSVIAATYRSGGTDQLVSLVNTSTPQTFLDQAGALNRIAAGQSAQLAAAGTARHRLAELRSEAVAAQAAQDAVARAMASQRSRIEATLATERRLLGTLQAQERARLEAARRARLARAAQQASSAGRASRSRASSPVTVTAPQASAPSAPGYSGPASGRAGVAVQAAYAQLGKPYVWGASGPNSFDCSGLTAWAWARAGVFLSHSSQAQFGEGSHVSQGSLQPGDLVFYGSPIHHVGIYVGGGSMISAPHTGDVVKVQAAFRSDYVGAVRP